MNNNIKLRKQRKENNKGNRKPNPLCETAHWFTEAPGFATRFRQDQLHMPTLPSSATRPTRCRSFQTANHTLLLLTISASTKYHVSCPIINTQRNYLFIFPCNGTLWLFLLCPCHIPAFLEIPTSDYCPRLAALFLWYIIFVFSEWKWGWFSTREMVGKMGLVNRRRARKGRRSCRPFRNSMILARKCLTAVIPAPFRRPKRSKSLEVFWV